MLCDAEASDAALSAACASVPERQFSAEAYWARLRPALGGFGITRIADITGLDHVGWPVAQAVRPWARSNAVTQGKGPSLAAAAVGAALECLEMEAGEDAARLPAAAPGDPALWQGLSGGAGWKIDDWVRTWRIDTGAWAAVPRAVLDTDFSRGAAAEAAPILRVSIGLGAGADLGAAIWHGMLEAVEGDARIRAEATGRMARITGSGLAHDAAVAAGLRVALWSMPCAGGLVAVKASVMEAPGATALPLPAAGYAARGTAAAAVEAAVSEALQARLAVISGAREDLTQAVYAHGVPPDLLEAEWARHAPSTARRLGNPIAPPDSPEALAARIGPVFAVVLRWRPDLPLAITRIVAPSLVTDPLQVGGAL